MSYGQEPSDLRRASSTSWSSAIQPYLEQDHGWSVLSFQPGDGLTRLLLDPCIVIRVSWLSVSLKSLTVEQTWSTDALVSTPSSSHGPDVSCPTSSLRRFRLEGCLFARAWQRHGAPHPHQLRISPTALTVPPKHTVHEVSVPARAAHTLDGWQSWLGTSQRSVPAASFSSVHGGLAPVPGDRTGLQTIPHPAMHGAAPPVPYGC